MEKFNTALRNLTQDNKITLTFLKDFIGITTKKIILITPLDESKNGVQQINFLKSAYKRIWDRLQGNHIEDQQIANFLFKKYVVNLPIAEKALIFWITKEENTKVKSLTEDMVYNFNSLVLNTSNFYSEYNKIIEHLTLPPVINNIIPIENKTFWTKFKEFFKL